MLETLAILFAGYSGYAGWPWWGAAALGALAGVWNACTRFYLGPWRDRLEAAGATRRAAIKALVLVSAWTGSMAAVMFTAGWYVARLLFL
jgi:hypothetical protein